MTLVPLAEHTSLIEPLVKPDAFVEPASSVVPAGTMPGVVRI